MGLGTPRAAHLPRLGLISHPRSPPATPFPQRTDVDSLPRPPAPAAGKTIQLVSVIAAVLGDPTSAPIIVAMPKSLIDNWKRELGRWAPLLRPAIFHGPRKWAALQDVADRRAPLLITTYNTLATCIDDLRRVKWEAAFFDEARPWAVDGGRSPPHRAPPEPAHARAQPPHPAPRARQAHELGLKVSNGEASSKRMTAANLLEGPDGGPTVRVLASGTPFKAPPPSPPPSPQPPLLLQHARSRAAVLLAHLTTAPRPALPRTRAAATSGSSWTSASPGSSASSRTSRRAT